MEPSNVLRGSSYHKLSLDCQNPPSEITPRPQNICSRFLFSLCQWINDCFGTNEDSNATELERHRRQFSTEGVSSLALKRALRRAETASELRLLHFKIVSFVSNVTVYRGSYHDWPLAMTVRHATVRPIIMRFSVLLEIDVFG